METTRVLIDDSKEKTLSFTVAIVDTAKISKSSLGSFFGIELIDIPEHFRSTAVLQYLEEIEIVPSFDSNMNSESIKEKIEYLTSIKKKLMQMFDCEVLWSV